MTRTFTPNPHPLAALVAAFVWPILLLLAIVVVGLVLAFPAPARRPAPVVIAPPPPASRALPVRKPLSRAPSRAVCEHLDGSAAVRLRWCAMTVPAMHDADSFNRGRREAYLAVRRLLLAGVGRSAPPDTTERCLLIVAEYCTVEAERATTVNDERSGGTR